MLSVTCSSIVALRGQPILRYRYLIRVSGEGLGRPEVYPKSFLPWKTKFPRLERNFRLEMCALILQQQLTELVLSGRFVGDALG